MGTNKLNIKIILVSLILLMTSFPSFTFSQSSEGSFDMSLYSAVAGYGFAAFLLIFFSYLIYCTSADYKEPVKIAEVKIIPAAAQKITTAALQGLNAVYYSVVILIALYIITFVLLMF